MAIELAEGRPPLFDKTSSAAIMAILANPPPKLTLTAAWSSEFHDFIAKCLIKDYDQRYVRVGSAGVDKPTIILTAPSCPEHNTPAHMRKLCGEVRVFSPLT